MLNVARLFCSLSVCLLAGGIPTSFSDSTELNGKTIQKNILGREVTSLYESHGFLKLEIDNEYDDLDKGELFWIAIDSNHEFLTLRTQDDIVVEIIIVNPDLQSERGIAVGDRLNIFLQAYPHAVNLTTYRNGIKRQLIAYCVEEEKLEVEFYQGKIFSLRVLERCR